MMSEKIGPAEISTDERWDLLMLGRCLDADDTDPQTKSNLKQVRVRSDADGRLTNKYRLGPCGRYSASFGYQIVPGWIKRLCSHRFFIDLDFVNCHPVSLSQICIIENIDCPFLTNYVLNRDAVLLEIGGSRDAAKQRVLSVMNNGSIKTTDGPLITLMAVEFGRIRRTLMERPKYAHVRKIVDDDKSRSNKSGTFISYLMCRVESQCLLAFRRWLTLNGFTVGSLQHDGLHVGVDKPFKPTGCESAQKYIFDTTGFRQTIKVKSLLPTVQDKQRLGVKHTTTITTVVGDRPLVVFDCHGVLQDYSAGVLNRHLIESVVQSGMRVAI